MFRARSFQSTRPRFQNAPRDDRRVSKNQPKRVGNGRERCLQSWEFAAQVVKGPCCCISDLCGATFSVESADGRDIGGVKKLGIEDATGLAKEIGTDADNYEIDFPVDLSVDTKALMIGALLLLDYTCN